MLFQTTELIIAAQILFLVTVMFITKFVKNVLQNQIATSSNPERKYWLLTRLK